VEEVNIPCLASPAFPPPACHPGFLHQLPVVWSRRERREEGGRVRELLEATQSYSVVVLNCSKQFLRVAVSWSKATRPSSSSLPFAPISLFLNTTRRHAKTFQRPSSLSSTPPLTRQRNWKSAHFGRRGRRGSLSRGIARVRRHEDGPRPRNRPSPYDPRVVHQSRRSSTPAFPSLPFQPYALALNINMPALRQAVPFGICTRSVGRSAGGRAFSLFLPPLFSSSNSSRPSRRLHPPYSRRMRQGRSLDDRGRFRMPRGASKQSLTFSSR
jgi:hypothetical protein